MEATEARPVKGGDDVHYQKRSKSGTNDPIRTHSVGDSRKQLVVRHGSNNEVWLETCVEHLASSHRFVQ